MNQRERILAISVLAAVILAVGGFLFKWLFLDSLGRVRTDIETAKSDIGKKKAELAKLQAEDEAIQRDDPRLETWEEWSLPDDNNLAAEIKSGHSPEEAAKRHLDMVQVDYSHYLNDLVGKAGFTPSSIKVSSAPADRKGGPILSGKTPAYTRMSFTVQAQGKLDAVQAMLEDFYKTPLLHQVRNLTLTARPAAPTRTAGLGGLARGAPGAAPGQAGLPQGFPGAAPGFPGAAAGPGAAPGGVAGLPGVAPAGLGGFRANTPPSGDLDVSMTVEALLVTGAQKRDKLLPGSDASTIHTLARNTDGDKEGPYYRDMLDKNMFTGVAAKTTMKEDAEQVLSVVRLTSIWTSGRHWQATIYDQGKGGDVIQLNPYASVAPYDFEVKDSYGNTLVQGKVIKLNADGMIFQPGKTVKNSAGKDVFQGELHYCRWRSGDYLGKRLRTGTAAAGGGNPLGQGIGDLLDPLGMSDGGDTGLDTTRYIPGALDNVLKPDEIKALGLDEPK